MFKICKWQLKAMFFNPRFYIAICVGIVAHILCSIPLLDFAEQLQKPISVFEGFIYLSCDDYLMATAFLGIVLLVSDVPFTKKNETYTLLRISKKKWVMGKVLYLLLACIIYYFIVMTVGIIFISIDAYAGNFWSEPIFYLVKNPETTIASLYFPYNHIIKAFTPLSAAMIAITLNTLYGFIISLFFFFFNLHFRKSISFAIVMMIHVSGYLLISSFNGYKFVKYSLFGNSLLMYHNVNNSHNNLFMTYPQTYILFIALSIVLIFLIAKEIRKYDFRITVGTQE